MRVRWGNVGRAAAVVGLLALAVAWPRLEGGAPRVPSDVAVPVLVPAAKTPPASLPPHQPSSTPRPTPAPRFHPDPATTEFSFETG